MKNDSAAEITYELWCQNSLKEWTCYKKEMNEEDAWLTAKAYSFSRKQFEKLAKHTSKKFFFLKKKSTSWWLIEINIVKKFPEKASKGSTVNLVANKKITNGNIQN